MLLESPECMSFGPFHGAWNSALFCNTTEASLLELWTISFLVSDNPSRVALRSDLATDKVHL